MSYVTVGVSVARLISSFGTRAHFYVTEHLPYTPSTSGLISIFGAIYNSCRCRSGDPFEL